MRWSHVIEGARVSILDQPGFLHRELVLHGEPLKSASERKAHLRSGAARTAMPSELHKRWRLVVAFERVEESAEPVKDLRFP